MSKLRIYTGCYDKCQSGNLVSISGDKGRSVGFIGNSYIKLAPKKSFWNIWHDNIGKIDNNENNEYYMREFYKQVLAKLDANEVLNELQQFGEDVILLCFEEETEFCHRHLVATWLERNLKIRVPEVYTPAEGKIQLLERNTKFVEQFNMILDWHNDKEKE